MGVIYPLIFICHIEPAHENRASMVREGGVFPGMPAKIYVIIIS